MPGWLSRLFGRADSTGRETRGRGHGDGGIAPFAATPIVAAGSGDEQDAEGRSDPHATSGSIGSDAGSDGGGSCGASCGAA